MSPIGKIVALGGKSLGAGSTFCEIDLTGAPPMLNRVASASIAAAAKGAATVAAKAPGGGTAARAAGKLGEVVYP